MICLSSFEIFIWVVDRAFSSNNGFSGSIIFLINPLYFEGASTVSAGFSSSLKPC
jgi:hypothetical protein